MLLGLLVVSASACGKSTTETSAAQAQPGVAAGKVLEVKGTVSVKHGAQTKPLAVGESVEGEDTIVTGADGNVVIELAHNSARWELGSNKTQRVRDSIAWNAKKATAQEIDQATAAAGRPAERSAAGTVAMEGEAAMNEEARAPSAPEPEAATEDLAPKGGGAPPAPAPPRRRAVAKSAPAAAPEAAMAPPPPPAPEPASDDEFRPARTRGPIAKAAPKTEAAPVAPAAPVAAAAPAPPAPGGGAAPPPTPTQQVTAKAAALKKCMADHGGKDEIRLVVSVKDGKGTATLTSKSAVSAGLDQCVKGVVGGISFVLTGMATYVIKP